MSNEKRRSENQCVVCSDCVRARACIIHRKTPRAKQRFTVLQTCSFCTTHTYFRTPDPSRAPFLRFPARKNSPHSPRAYVEQNTKALSFKCKTQAPSHTRTNPAVSKTPRAVFPPTVGNSTPCAEQRPSTQKGFRPLELGCALSPMLSHHALVARAAEAPTNARRNAPAV